MAEELAARPTLYRDLPPVWSAFWLASAGRSNNGMSPLPIAGQEIQAVLDLRGVHDYDKRLEFFELIRGMDVRAWLPWARGQGPEGEPEEQNAEPTSRD
jgi:hypothetical protein